MITSIFDLKNGDKFAFSCEENIIPKWSQRTRHLFSKHFKERCLNLLCIQKYFLKYIDKNIFFLLIEKMAKGNCGLIPNEKFHDFLYYLKELEVEKVRRKIKLNTIICGKSNDIIYTKEYFPMIYKYRKEPHILNILQREKVLGIFEAGECKINFYVLKDDKINLLTLNLNFNFFHNKKKQRQLFDMLKYNFSNIVQTHNCKVKKYRLIIFLTFLIVLFFLISYIFY